MYKTDKEKFMEAISIIEHATAKAINKHAPMITPHEGKAVIEEELDELWDEIKKRNPDESILLNEASHIGAMAARFIIDLLLE